MAHERVALVTGASSGIGKATAELLARCGYRVFGTSRAAKPDAAITFALIPLDVRSDASAAAAVDAVIRQAGRIDLLVNNAGYSQAGAIEENSITDARDQLETNVLGAMRMVQAALPHMRRQRSGRIISVSSVLGHVAPPCVGLYAMSKFALEGLCEALRYEVKQFNVQVSLIEPAFVKSNIGVTPPTHPLPDYADLRELASRFTANGVRQGMAASLVARAVLHAATAAHPRLRYRVGRRAHLLITLKRLLPERLFERVRQRVFAAGSRAGASAPVEVSP